MKRCFQVPPDFFNNFFINLFLFVSVIRQSLYPVQQTSQMMRNATRLQFSRTRHVIRRHQKARRSIRPVLRACVPSLLSAFMGRRRSSRRLSSILGLKGMKTDSFVETAGSTVKRLKTT